MHISDSSPATFRILKKVTKQLGSVCTLGLDWTKRLGCEAHTNAVAKYAVPEVHTCDLTSRPKVADEPGC